MTATIERPTTQAQPDSNKEPWSQLSELDALLDEPQDNTGNQPAETLESTAMPSERAGSRLGKWLRSLADRADSASNFITNEKNIVHENLVSLGQAAKSVAETTRSTIIDAGAATLNVAKEAGLTTVGLGIMGAEKTATAMQDQFNKGEEFGYKATTAALEFGQDKVSQAREWLQQKRDAALTRKTARRAKWLARFNAVKESATELLINTRDVAVGAIETAVDAGLNTMDRTKDLAINAAEAATEAGRKAIDHTRDAVMNTVERTRETAHVARAIGAAAIDAAVSTKQAHADQK